LFILL